MSYVNRMGELKYSIHYHQIIYLLVFFVCFTEEIITGSDKFADVRFLPDFVDKTLLIKEFFNLEKPLVIASPDGFGKTTNLDMIKTFLNIDTNRTYGESLFGNTKIFQDEDLMREMGNHSVLYCSLKADQPITDYKSMIHAFRTILFRMYAMHPYLKLSKKITRFDKKRLTCYTGVKKYQVMRPNEILVGLQFLSKLLKQHHERDVILIIDDYDSVILDSLFTNELDHEMVLGFHNAILSPVIHKNQYVTKILIAGNTCICIKPLKQFDQLECLGFLEDKTFLPFFGLTDSEVEELLDRDEFKGMKDKKEDIKKWYDGYTSCDHKSHVYNTRSTLSFLNCSGEFKSYWVSTRALKTIKYLLIEPFVQQLLNESISYKTCNIHLSEKINVTHMKGLKSFTETELWDQNYADIFLRLLMEKGYFTYAKEWSKGDKKLSIRIPNQEILKVFEKINIDFRADPIDLLDRLKEAVRLASFTDVTEKIEIETFMDRSN